MDEDTDYMPPLVGQPLQCVSCNALRSRVRELEGGLKDIRRLAHTLLAQTKEAMPFMLPAPKPATPIPPDPRDAVVEAVGRWTDYTEGLLRTGMYELGDLGELVREVVLKVRALRATEGRG